MKCKICSSDSSLLFKAKVLNKYDVAYYQCSSCDFIQTENPYWLDEAYSNAIADLDVGLVDRNLDFSNRLESVFDKHFKKGFKGLDFGGGYGLFVRIMRDRGFDFYRYDPYCENIFAKYFNVESAKEGEKFDLVTAFEVFEHLVDPIEELKKILAFGDNVLFSTLLIPDKKISQSSDWWYFVPETGQHVAFYSVKSLKIISELYNKHFYTNGANLHLFSKEKLSEDPFKKKKKSKLRSLFSSSQKVKRESLAESDLNKIKNILLG